jgi:hypothetical protein
MNPITIVLGVLACGYGVFTLVMRSKHPKIFSKLNAVKQFWGERAGFVIHVVAYTVMPLAIGIAFILLGIRGGSIF